MNIQRAVRYMLTDNCEQAQLQVQPTTQGEPFLGSLREAYITDKLRQCTSLSLWLVLTHPKDSGPEGELRQALGRLPPACDAYGAAYALAHTIHYYCTLDN